MNTFFEDIWACRVECLRFYPAFSFIFRNDSSHQYFNLFQSQLTYKIDKGEIEVVEINCSGHSFVFLIEQLHWDSDFFEIPIIKLHTVVYSCNNYVSLVMAVKKYVELFKGRFFGSCFIEIPSEDILLIQALCENGFRLVETRLHYYKYISDYSSAERYKVRMATSDDIPNLSRVAKDMRNLYDRFHADITFTSEIADRFLERYAEECVNGFSDITLVPSIDDTPPDAFLSANYLDELWSKLGRNVSKLTLTAVSSKTRKGWYRKLISEMLYQLKEKGAEYCVMVPASSNKASIHIFETISCKLGKVTHILSL